MKTTTAYAVVTRGAGGELQNVCDGETFESADIAELALEVLSDDGRVDTRGPFAAFVARVPA